MRSLAGVSRDPTYGRKERCAVGARRGCLSGKPAGSAGYPHRQVWVDEFRQASGMSTNPGHQPSELARGGSERVRDESVSKHRKRWSRGPKLDEMILCFDKRHYQFVFHVVFPQFSPDHHYFPFHRFPELFVHLKAPAR